MSEPTQLGLGVCTAPLFPLPNVVLFPRAVLPLHIFEERYRQMMADALDGERLIAMALLRPGWEKDYYGHPSIEPVVCIGRILNHERLDDGCYNLLLQGQARARILREKIQRPYRLAELQLLEETAPLDIDLLPYRRELRELFSSSPLARASFASQFRKLIDSLLPTSEVADLLAFNLLDDLELKQALLAETDVLRRVAAVVREVRRLYPVPRPAAIGNIHLN